MYRGLKNPDVCKEICGHSPYSAQPCVEDVDIFDLAKKLRDAEMQKWKEATELKIPQRSYCPKCEECSLFFDSIHNQFECLNIGCSMYGKPITYASELYVEITVKLFKKE
jgi:hypothetical protein